MIETYFLNHDKKILGKASPASFTPASSPHPSARKTPSPHSARPPNPGPNPSLA